MFSTFRCSVIDYSIRVLVVVDCLSWSASSSTFGRYCITFHSFFSPTFRVTCYHGITNMFVRRIG